VDTEITLTAAVQDQETPIEQLKFEWKADAGTFSGDGAVVKWRAPKDIKTPADYEIKLTVTETSGHQTLRECVPRTYQQDRFQECVCTTRAKSSRIFRSSS